MVVVTIYTHTAQEMHTPSDDDDDHEVKDGHLKIVIIVVWKVYTKATVAGAYDYHQRF